MRFLIALVFFVYTFTLHAQNWPWQEKVVGNHEVAKENRDFKDFNRIHTSRKIKVILTPSQQYEVIVEAESNLLEYIETKTLGSKLIIRVTDGVRLKNNKPLIVYVSLPELREVESSSGSKVSSVDTFTGSNLSMHASSGADIVLEYQGEEVELSASSGAKIVLAGRSKTLECEASSGSKISAKDVESDEVEASVSSGASIYLHVNKHLIGKASSGGKIRYTGKPETVNNKSSSGGSIKEGI